MYNCFYEEKPLGEIIMHVLVDQEHDGPPRTKSHDLRHYALVERQEPATVNHGDLCSQVNRHLPFLSVHPCDHPSSSPVNLFPLRLGALSTNTIFTSRGKFPLETLFTLAKNTALIVSRSPMLVVILRLRPCPPESATWPRQREY